MNSPTDVAIEMRAATAADAESLTALALRSKAYWGYSQAFMAACRDELTVTADAVGDPGIRIRVAAFDDEIVGYYAVARLSEAEFELDALFVEPAWIGRGLGRRLVADASRVALDWGATSVLIQGDPNAGPFYEALGAVRIGTRASGSVEGRELPLYRLELMR